MHMIALMQTEILFNLFYSIILLNFVIPIYYKEPDNKMWYFRVIRYIGLHRYAADYSY